MDPAFPSVDKLLETVDSLPGGVRWNLHEIVLTGDIMDDEGSPRTEHLELWWRDPLDCIRDLIGNPVFREVMRYAPERLYEDAERESQVINEMSSAAWWWKLQVRQ